MRLADDAVKAFRVVTTMTIQSGGCTRRNPEVLLAAVSRKLGERLGAAYATCSSVADQIVTDTPSEDERKTKLEPHWRRYVTDILKRSGLPAQP